MLSLEKYNVDPLIHATPLDDTQISPDGRNVLFVRRITKIKEDRYDTHIWIAPTNGDEPRQFTFGEGSDTHPRWSLDGTQILFTSNRLTAGEKENKKTRIWSMPFEGGEAKLLIEAEHNIRDFQLSPDGKKILIQSRIEEDTETPEEVNPEILWINKLRYKYDGEPYFPYTRVHLFTVSSKGGRPVQITNGPYDVAAAAWSPDSTEVAFVANREESDLTRLKDIYIKKADGGEPRKVTDGKSIIHTVSWSPDGALLAYAGRVPPDPIAIGYGNTDIWVISPDGDDVRNLTNAFDRTLRRVKELKWSPDSKHIYFTYPDKGSTQIGRADIDGTVEPVTEGEISISSFSICMDGSILAFCATDALWPNEVWIKDGKKTRRLTNIQAKTMEIWDVSPPEMFWFKASDGVKVQGWIIKPHGYEEDKKYPLILEIHGGPHSAYGYKLGPAEHEFQLLARNGYVVVYTNPRDSVGYGEEFAGIVEGNWGSRDFQDIMEAVDHVLENYDYIDPERLGVAGGSYGGFMTNWIVGHTDRFKAAVTMRSITLWYSDWGTSDISYRGHSITWGKDPWDNVEEILKKSPITYVKNVNTPLLIIHSENDYRCPMGQDELLFTALKKLGKTTEFIRFPDEPHGLSRTGKPKHRIERLQHIVRWFDRYLK
jgi:dipeptidyl aminopeptidase/acylaminoacyl peptidase